MTRSDAEIFLEHLRDIFGNEDAIHQAEASDGGPPVSVFVYRDIPEPGMITGVTFGLSLCDFPAWKYARPEMIVSVNSTNIEWPMAAASFVSGFRGTRKFQYGDVYTTDVPLAADTSMQGFLVFAQSILDDEAVSVQLGNYKVHFSQLYPIYKEEVAVYQKIGLEAFWKHKDFEMYDVQRNPIRA